MRLPFLRPKPATEPVRPAAQRAERARRAPADAGGDVAAARARARRRLVGALVLLLVGVIGFPVLFETQPRPLPLDIPIEMSAGEVRAVKPAAPPPGRPLPVLSVPADAGVEGSNAAPAAPVPATAPAALPVKPPLAAAASAPTETVLEPRRVPPAAVTAPASVLAKAPAAKASAPLAAAPAAPRPQAAASRPADGARAAALLAGTASAPPAAAAEGRFVVQVGAYTDATTLRAARAKVEKLGLKTYTQVIEGDAGKRTRVRLGPYATRAEADAAAAKLRGAGLPGNVLAL